jgi:fucose 4-O-acetylase-like acetyltransferase
MGDSEITVEWYRTLGELARGFRKNSFAAMQYSVVLAFGAVVVNMALGVTPFVAVWLTSGWERTLWTTAAFAQMLGYASIAWTRHMKPWLALLYPIAGLLFVAIFMAAVTRTLRRRGIEWRGTFYPLDQLRAKRR